MLTDWASPAPWLSVALVAGVSYFIGSIPTSTLVARLYGKRGVDLTRVGSARTGAANATRVLGPVAGILVLLGDFGKGAGAVLLAQQIGVWPSSVAVAGFFSVVGHARSLFLRGRGGRGVATGLGGAAVAETAIFLPACLVGCIVAATTRYVSLGSIFGCAIGALAAVALFIAGRIPWQILVYVLVTSGFIIAEHRDNIGRLRHGIERKLGER